MPPSKQQNSNPAATPQNSHPKKTTFPLRVRGGPLLLICSLMATLLITAQHSNLFALTPVTEVIVKTGDKAPDNDGTFDLGLSGQVAVLNNCGWAAFRGSLSGATNGR